MGLNILTYAAAKKYVDKTLVGGGALKGKNCVITDISPIEGGNRVTFQWTLDDGTVETDTMDVMDGAEGQKGEKGDRGAIGPQGLQGIQGVQGETGLTGAQGPQGIQGIQGEQGIQGIQGPKGDDGYPFLIYKQYDDISEFDESDFPEVGLMFMVMVEDEDPETHQSIGYPIYRYTGEGNPPYSLVVHLASQGIKGEKGDKGDTGAQGPKGDTGEQGAKGDKGEKGDTGAQGIQGEQGVGLPDGGNAGDVLVKYSNTDYDFDWKGTTDNVRPNSHSLVESGAVYNAIINAVSSIYTPRGDLTCAELTSSLLIEANVGNVYEMSDAGETTALFLQGAGETINIGDNVGVIKAGANTYLFNLMANAFDLTDYQKKDLVNAVEGATTVEDALGALSTNKATQAEVDVLIENGAINLLRNNATTNTIQGVTFTVNDDGTVTANGTATADAELTLNINSPSAIQGLETGNYKLSGCPSGGGSGTYRLFAKGTSNSYYNDDGAGVAISNDGIRYVRILVGNGVTVSNLVFKPMVTAPSYNGDYVPYAMTNKQLTDNKADKVSGATNNNLASLDTNGNLVDSGVSKNYVLRRSPNSTTAVDCNDLIDLFTEYRVGDGDANRPTTSTDAYIIRTFRTGGSSSVYSQIAYQISGMAIYRRNCNSSGVWSSWEKLVTESDITPTQIVSYTKTGGGAFYLKVYKSGGMKYINITGDSTSQALTNGELYTLTGNAVPTIPVTFPCYYVQVGVASKVGFIYIGTNGKVQLRDADYEIVTANVTYIRGQGWYY